MLSITATLVNIIEKGLTQNTDAMIQYLEKLKLVTEVQKDIRIIRLIFATIQTL